MSDTKKEYKKYIKKINTPKISFNERLVFYKKCFIDYKNWRLNFKFPKTDYLSRIKTIKPIPPNKLLIDLGKSISELREEFINLKGYKQMIIFKLFLFYFAEVFKVINKIKIAKSVSGPFSGWITGGKSPSRRDIDLIMGEIPIIFDFESSFSDRYEKTKPGHKRKSGDVVGTSWEWVKIKKFKWNSKWKKNNKKYGYQKNFSTKDHYKGEPRSLIETNKITQNFDKLLSKNKSNDAIQIADLFFNLSYCKDFDEIEKIFSNETKSEIIKHKFSDWLPLENEITKDEKYGFDNTDLYKQRIFPQFTIKNIKKRFNKDVFIKELTNPKNGSVKLSLAISLNGHRELEYAFEYDELLPDMDLILPAYTSGSLYNYLDNDLSFLTLFRTNLTILELAESWGDCVGILSDKKQKKSYILHYSGNRDGTTDCSFVKEIKYGNFKKDKELSNFLNKKIIDRLFIAPDTVILNKDYKWDLKKMFKILKPKTKEKRDQFLDFIDEDEDDYHEKQKEQKNVGTYFYLLNSNQINNQITNSKMDGSIRFSFPKKRGKIDFSADAKISPYSEIEIKHSYFI